MRAGQYLITDVDVACEALSQFLAWLACRGVVAIACAHSFWSQCCVAWKVGCVRNCLRAISIGAGPAQLLAGSPLSRAHHQPFVFSSSMFKRPPGSSPPWKRPPVQSRSPPRHSTVQSQRSGSTSACATGSDAAVTPHSFSRFANAVVYLGAKKTHPTSVHQALGFSCNSTRSSPDGPGPGKNLEMLKKYIAQGGDAVQALDDIMQGRLGSSLWEGTVSTYTSHLFLIGHFAK